MRLSYLFNKTTSKEPEDVVPGAAVVKRVSLHKVKATFFFFFFCTGSQDSFKSFDWQNN